MATRGGERKRSGDFSATGEFKWYALAEEPGAIQKENGYEVLDLRKKVRVVPPPSPLSAVSLNLCPCCPLGVQANS